MAADPLAALAHKYRRPRIAIFTAPAYPSARAALRAIALVDRRVAVVGDDIDLPASALFDFRVAH